MTFGMISIAETTTDIITLDTPIEELNDLTLNELFIDNNILLNSNFNGSTNWNLQFATGSVNDNIYTYTPTGNFGGIIQSVNMINTNVYYISSTVKSLSNSTNLSVAGAGLITHSGSNIYETLNNRFTWTSPSGNYNYRIQTSIFNPNQVLVNGIKGNYLLNLTSLNLTSLTKTQIDNYYNIYINGGYYEYDAILNDLDMTDFIIISSSFVLWLWFIRFVKGVL
jgi:hypothetical protein